ncbi:MAG: transposase [Verrucomicrobia bacterium]|jgi:hypothetical protein|nr:transposase [Verrucomicrobiota bacterium]
MNNSISLQIGIDWADQKHDYCLCPFQPEPGQVQAKNESGIVSSSPEKLHEWIMQVRQRFPDGVIEVCVELSRGALINALREYDFIRIYPLNPISSNRFRECLYPSLTKDDVKDASLLLTILQKHREHLRVLTAGQRDSCLLEGLVQARRKYVNQRTALVQQLTTNLKEYYPQALGMVGDLSERMSRRFLKKWPSWDELSRVREHTLRKFYYANQSRSEARIEARLNLHRNSRPLSNNETTIELGRMQTIMLVEQLETLDKIIHEYSRKIEPLYRSHEKSTVINSLPGAGKIMGPRLICAMEGNLPACRNAAELSSYSGIAPLRQKSGNSSRISKRFRRPKFLHQTFIEWAQCSIKYSSWAKAFYDHRRHSLGHDHWAVVRALAFKWIRILYKCWEDNTAYNEENYIQTLKRRGSKLAELI